MKVAPGATSVITYWNLEITGLTITDLDLTYTRDQAAAVKSDLVAHGAVTDAFDDNEAIEVDSTNAPGLYRVDVPDAAFAAGVDKVQLCINGAAITPQHMEVELDGKIGTGVSLDSGEATVCGMLTKMADDNAGADFDAETDSQQAIRDTIGVGGASLGDLGGMSTAMKAEVKTEAQAGVDASTDMEKTKDDVATILVRLRTGTVQTVNPLSSTGKLTIVQRDDYSTGEGRQIQFSSTSSAWGNGDITGYKPRFRFRDKKSGANIDLSTGRVNITASTGTQVVQIAPLSTDTAQLRLGRSYDYQLRLISTSTTGPKLETIKTGEVVVEQTLLGAAT